MLLSTRCRAPVLFAAFLLSLSQCSASAPRPASPQNETHDDLIVLRPDGPYGVNSRSLRLTDPARNNEPLAPGAARRSVLATTYYPSARAADCAPRLVDYVAPAVVPLVDALGGAYGIPNGTFGRLRLARCAGADDAHITAGLAARPLVLFSPGFGGPTLVYQALLQQLASQGYVVVAVDHPLDAAFVRFPDGEIVRGIPLPNSTDPAVVGKFVTPFVRVRARDASFVLDQLDDPEVVQQLLPGARGPRNTSHVAMFGHSLGGPTAAAAALDDARIRGAFNMDGNFYGLDERAVEQPVVIMGTPNHTVAGEPTWADFWRRQQQQQPGAWKLELTPAGTEHMSHVDLPVILQAAGLEIPDAVTRIGTVEGRRFIHVVTTYVAAFVDFVLRGAAPAVLQGPVAEFPDVRFNATGADVAGGNGTAPAGSSPAV